MLFFSKPSPYLCDLIPDNHIDIHSHLLPSIDDGASSLSDSIALIKAMYAMGIKSFITTPHVMKAVWENNPEIINTAERLVLEAVRLNNIPIQIRAAAEYMMDDNFESLIKTEALLVLKDNYVLVEMSYLSPPLGLYSMLNDLKVAGYIPVLAHPERYLFYFNQFYEYEKLKKAGCLFQLNCNSVTGYYGKNVAETAQLLLQSGMYDFIGTDVHHQNHIKAIKQKVVFKTGTELKELFSNNEVFR